ncbi:MAG: VOC family protein [Litorimonas sp.]
MIGYTTLGVKDIGAAKKFYTELFDAEVLVDVGRLAMIGTDFAQPKVAVCEPFNGEAPSVGNGSMVAFPGGSTEGVDTFYKKALSLGATCDGEPGVRIDDVFYGAYVRDADGNKLCFFHFL